MKPKLALILAVLAVPLGAAAEPPSNDEPASALAIDALPFEHVGDHLEATWSEAEPVPCWDPTRDHGHRSLSLYGDVQTLWYRYTAQEPIILSPAAYRHNEIDFGPGPDLGVYVESPEGLVLIACSSSGVEDWAVPPPFLAQPEHTYFFVVGMDASPGTRLASFYLNSPQPFDVAIASLTAAPAHARTHDPVGPDAVDVTIEIRRDEPPSSTDLPGLWSMWLCPHGPTADSSTCREVASGWENLAYGPVTVSRRITGVRAGEFTLRAEVWPSWTLDFDPADNQRSIKVEFLAEGLGFGIGI